MDIIAEAARTGRVGGSRVFVTKAKIDLFTSDDGGEKLVDAFCNAALKGRAEDGKIFVHPAEDAIRIRTKKRREATQRIT